MSATSKVFDLLVRSRNQAADDCLLEALDAGLTDCGQQVVKTLLARGEASGLAGLISRYHLLSGEQQQVILRGVERLFSALRTCIRAALPQTRLNTVIIIRQSGDLRLTYLLSLALHDTAPRVREEAARAFLEIAPRQRQQRADVLAILTADPTPSYESALAQSCALAGLHEQWHYLFSALESALDSFDVHHRTEVIEAVLAFAHRPGSGLWMRIGESRGRLGRAVIENFQKLDAVSLAPFVYLALTAGELRPAVLRTLNSYRSAEFLAYMVEHAFLLADPQIRKGVAHVKNASWLSDEVVQVLALPAEMHAKAVSLLLATGLSAEAKVGVLRDMLVVGPRSAQRAAFWGLVQLDCHSATQVLEGLADSNQSEWAEFARLELRQRRPISRPAAPGREKLDRPATPPAHDEPQGRQAFERFWESCRRAGWELDSEVLRQMCSSVPDPVSGLRSKLISPDAADRLGALRIARELQFCQACEGEIIALSRDPNAKARSAAAIALGQMSGASAERALYEILHDEDRRVQANAIEALEQQRSRDRIRLFLSMMRSPDNRVRANAIRALLPLQVRQAGASLLEMLESQEPAHRLSALWVVEQLGLLNVAQRVVKLARQDPVDKVRQRALQASAGLRDDAPQRPATQPQEVHA